MSSKPVSYLYRFGPFCLDTKKGLLIREANDEIVRLSEKEFKILLLLVENPQHLFSAQELLDKVWPEDTVIEENNVAQKISSLRKHLGETAGQNKYIQTLDKAYRFVARLERLEEEPPIKDEPTVQETRAQEEQGHPPTTERVVENKFAIQEADEESPAAESYTGALDEGMNTFEGWLRGHGIVIALIITSCALLTIGVSIKGLLTDWIWTNLFASMAHLGILLIALLYPLYGPKGFKESGDRLSEDIRKSTGYDNPQDWDEASEIAEKSLERYKLYWRGILFTWFLLYTCLTITSLPDLDLNCQANTMRFCVGGLSDPTTLAVKLQDSRNPLSTYLRGQFPVETQRQLEAYDGSAPPPKQLQHALVSELNQRLNDCCLYDDKRFEEVSLPKETHSLIASKLTDDARIRLNRSLLQAAYPEIRQDQFIQRLGLTLSILNTLFNNCSSLMIFLCFNILNKPIVIKKGKRNISDTSLSIGAAFVLIVTLVETLLVISQISLEKKYLILQWGGWSSGIAGGIAMALYVGRLQSKFLGPRAWLLFALYSYTAIQPLFVLLEERPVAAVILIDFALILKCLLFLYMMWLFQSGRLLFYFVRVRRAYREVKMEWQIFRRITE